MLLLIIMKKKKKFIFKKNLNFNNHNKNDNIIINKTIEIIQVKIIINNNINKDKNPLSLINQDSLNKNQFKFLHNKIEIKIIFSMIMKKIINT